MTDTNHDAQQIPHRASSGTFWYSVTVFVSSACLMVLEIVAGRLIAPYVGVSLYTWTSIIGVILAGLSLGNWLGGLWADRGADGRAAANTLILAALFSVGTLLVLTMVAPAIQTAQIDLLTASFLYVLSLFFVPALLLGVVTPLLTTLALQRDSRTGHVVGRMHALAAFGSIVGTFLTGYWLVQWFGTVRIVMGTAIVLFLLALPLLRGKPKAVPAALVVLAIPLLIITGTRQGFADPCEVSSRYFCIRMLDEKLPFGTARTLVLDHLGHGTNHREDPTLLLSPYVHLMDELVQHRFDSESLERLRWFFVGGGAYTLPRAVMSRWPGAGVTVSELDPVVTQTAHDKLYVDTAGMRVVHTDARVVLAREERRYDVIIGDAFHDISIPYHLITREYTELVRARLAPNGLYLINVVDAFPDPRLVKAIVKGLEQVFEHVDVWMDHLPETPTRVTLVISAADGLPMPDRLYAESGFPRRWFRVNEPLRATGTPSAALPLLTDDFVPVERLVSTLLTGKEGL